MEEKQGRVQKIRSHFKNYGLSWIFFLQFVISLALYWVFLNLHSQNEGKTSYEYLAGIFENLQSEAFQVFMLIVLATYFIHKNSPQSRDGDDRRDAEIAEIKKLGQDTRKGIAKLLEALTERQRTQTTGFVDSIRANEFGIARRIPETTYAMTIETDEQVEKKDIVKVIDDALTQASVDMEKQVVTQKPAAYPDEFVMLEQEESKSGWNAINDLIGTVNGPPNFAGYYPDYKSEEFSDERLLEVKQEALKQFLDNATNTEDAKRIVQKAGLSVETNDTGKSAR